LDKIASDQSGSGVPVKQRRSVVFNPFSPAFRENPYPTYELLRREAPFLKIMGSWYLSRRADIVSVLRDRRFSSSRIPELIRRGSGLTDKESYHEYNAIESFVAKAIVFTENPDHVRLRRLVNIAFDAAALAADQPVIEQIGRELLRDPLVRGGSDLIEDLADKLPMYFMCARLGVPREIAPTLRDWAREARLLLDPTLMSKKDYIRVEGIMRQALGYLNDVIALRKRLPGNDIISILLANRDKDDRLTEEEVALTCIMFFVAGHETTKYLIGNAVLALLRHPHEADDVRSAPEFMGNAIEEVLRFDAPLQQTKRVATTDIELGETIVREGEQVVLLLGSANHDPTVFEQPERFWIRRPNAKMHLGFGYGMRTCVGGALAHLEATVACRLLFSEDIRPSLVTDTVDWQAESVILRGLHALPITLERWSSPDDDGPTPRHLDSPFAGPRA
jgi:cytochrome P450